MTAPAWTAVAKPFRYAAAVTAVVVILGGWVYLYLQARAIDLGLANELMGELRQLGEIDSRWNDRLIGTRLTATPETAGTPRRVDAAALGRIHARLVAQSYALGSPLPAQSLTALREAFDTKARAVHEFEGAHSVLLERLAAFMQAAQVAGLATSGPDALPPAIQRDLDRLAVATLAYVAQPTPASARAAQSAADAVATAAVPAGLATQTSRLAESAQAVVRAKSLEDQLFRDAVYASTGPRLESLMRSFDRAFGNAVDEAERYRLYLLVYSGLLVLLALWLGWRLAETYAVVNRMNRELRVANETLETRVQERTAELSNALTQLKENEALLIQSEKMSSLGQMVAGVAHEVNTPLAYVKSSLDAVDGRMPKIGTALEACETLIALAQRENVDEATLSAQFAAATQALEAAHAHGALAELDRLVKNGLHGIGQISELVGNLKNFARLDRSKVAHFDLNEGVKSALVIAHSQLKNRKVRTALGNIPKVSCAPSQINQVFLNLLTNAAQATDEETGVISVRSFLKDDGHVAVEVLDNGHGIPEEIMGKIFDPFFTTKEVGKGTGLGLSICYKIVESHGGRIEVTSKQGVGTRFTVILPVEPALAAVPA